MRKGVVLGVILLFFPIVFGLFSRPGQHIQFVWQGKGISFQPYTLWCLQVVGWSERPNFIRGEKESDPVNLVFPGASTPDISDVLTSGGWEKIDGRCQFIYVEGQKLRATTQFIYYRDENERFHMRIFRIEDWGVIGNVHLEKEDKSGRHILVSWEEAEAFAAEAFGEFCATETEQINAFNFRGVASDGRAAIIDLLCRSTKYRFDGRIGAVLNSTPL